MCFPHLHSLDGGCGLNLQLNSSPSVFAYADEAEEQLIIGYK